MTDFIFTWFRSSVLQILIIVGPVLLVALVLGIIISILQVLTQIHDPSVAFVRSSWSSCFWFCFLVAPS